ncbi:MAG: hypothetical protein H6909_04040 [Rickettsiaceae bacterium]|nr:hypothetical protein [Rickettsiaceae bacterium]
MRKFISKDKPTCQINIAVVETAACVGTTMTIPVAAATSFSAGVGTAVSAAAVCSQAAGNIIKDPCVQAHTAYQVNSFHNHVAQSHASDAYIQHMPRHDMAAAVKYSAQMGGASHDMGVVIVRSCHKTYCSILLFLF